MKTFKIPLLFFSVLMLTALPLVGLKAQDKTDSLKLEKIRAESGVDPTRVMSRVGYTVLVYDKTGSAGQLNNRLSMNVGVSRWSFSAKYDAVMISPIIPGDIVVASATEPVRSSTGSGSAFLSRLKVKKVRPI